MEVKHSIKIANLANSFSKASIKLIDIAKSEIGNEKAISCVPAIYCAKHSAELYLKAILEEFNLNKKGHNQIRLLEEAFDLLETKHFIKNHQDQLIDFKKNIFSYHENIIAGIKIKLGKDENNDHFRYITKDTSWTKNLHLINLNLFKEEAENLKKKGLVLLNLAQLK